VFDMLVPNRKKRISEWLLWLPGGLDCAAVRIKPLVFSFVPRRQGLAGRAKKTPSAEYGASS
jgi:hypothetical protein